MSDLRTEWIADPGRFAALAGAWNALAEPAGSPFLLHEWLTAWWQAFGAGRTMAVCGVWRDEALVAALPLLRGHGGTLEAMANTHSPEFLPLAEDPDALRALVAAVAGGGSLVLPSATVTPQLRAALDGLPRRITFYDAMSPVPRVVLGGTGFDAYVADSRWRRKELPRLGRKLAGAVELTESYVADPVDLERELAEGFELEAAGWKGEAGTAIVSSPDTDSFYRLIAAAFAARGELRLSSMYAGGRLISWDLCILHSGRLHKLKTGFDESLSAYGVGNLLCLRTIERCCALGLDAYELGPGEEEYKRRFANAHEHPLSVRSHPVGPATLHRVAWGVLRPHLRRVYRRLRGRPAIERATSGPDA